MPTHASEPALPAASRPVTVKGRLRIYFGAAPGTGKTCAMLRDAHVRARELAAEGAPVAGVLVGAIETHGWPETAGLLAGLDALPPRRVEHRGATLQEFDLDAALLRRPALVVVDELAHGNAPGSRHARRWQDVRELTDAGLTVWTTLNVQHLESLANVVERVVGVEVRERVPDDVLERADELIMVDVPPDELLRRVRGAEHYRAPPEAHLALPQLVALRELALRIAAERAHAHALVVRGRAAGLAAGPAAERLLVCIGARAADARLVRAARRMAAGLQVPWLVVYLEPLDGARLDEEERIAAVQNLRLGELLGAEALTLSGLDLAGEVLALARLRHVGRIVVGKPLRRPWWRRLNPDLVDELVHRADDIDVHVISGEAETAPAVLSATARRRRRRTRTAWRDHGFALLLVALATLISLLLTGVLTLGGHCLVYMLAVVMAASRGRWFPAAVAAAVAALAFWLLVVPAGPGGARAAHGLGIAALLATGVGAGVLGARLRRRVAAAAQREARTAALHAMSRDLAAVRGAVPLLTAAVRHLQAAFSWPVALLMPDPAGRLAVQAGDAARCPSGSPDLVAAQWAFANARPAGLGTGTLDRVAGLHVPLVAGRGTVGVLSLYPAHRGQAALPERRQLVEAFAHQVALAVESDQLAVRAQQAQVEAEGERLRGALLSSVSHDLRTPLAAITGAATGLVEQDHLLDAASRRELALTIAEQGEHLARLVANLLDMVRVEAGKLRLTRLPHVLEDVIGAALTVLERALHGRAVIVEVPGELPTVPLDPILIQQVLVNLIENALKYSPAGSGLDVAAAREGDAVRVEVRDRGPGLAIDEVERVFEKFYRGSAQAGTAGVGLGLSICRGIVEAHGGRCWAANREGGGAVFAFTLPLAVGGEGIRPPPPTNAPSALPPRKTEEGGT